MKYPNRFLRRALVSAYCLVASLLFSSPASSQGDSAPGLAALLETGRAVFGVFGGQTPEQGALAAGVRGADFVFYSLEQPPFDLDAMDGFLSAMRAEETARERDPRPLVLRIPPVARDPEAARQRVAQAFEHGVDSIVVPHVQTAEEAQLAVEAIAAASAAISRPVGAGPVSLLIVEDKEGVKNAREIAATPGVGVVFAGPGDLARAYEGDRVAVEQAIQVVLAACKEHQVPCGITAGVDDIGQRLTEGFRVIIVTDNDSLVPGRQAARRLAVERDLATPRPIDALDSVWMEELTWMEVRDAIRDGKTTAIVATGGIEQNGPYLATGKHNVVLRAACEGIARKLGNALCAPILAFVPEGSISPPSGHMLYPGTISLRQETFEAVLEDVAGSLLAHGFEDVVLIGDSGGNQAGMKAVAERLDPGEDRRSEKTDTTTAPEGRVHYVPEFYRYFELIDWMGSELGIREPVNQGLHDDFAITAMMMSVDPESVRYQQRLDAGLASINGLSISNQEEVAVIGRKLLARRIEETVVAIRSVVDG